MPRLIQYCFIYFVVTFISIRISLFLENQVLWFFLEKIDERNISENIEQGNIEPITEGTVMIVRLQNQMK